MKGKKEIQQQEGQEKPSHIIDEIMADLTFYQNPDLLKVEYQDRLNTGSVDKTTLKEYTELFSSIRYAWQKILKYRGYFQDFYPSDNKIDKIEALNHHIHAYLEDMTTLKNKIEVLFGKMKNDIRKVATNKEDIDEFCKAGVEKTREVFSGITEHRDDHRHRGSRFFDGDLLKAENAQGFLQILETPMMNDMINQEYKPKVVEKFTEEREEGFQAAKNRWIKTAERNDTQTAGYLEAILGEICPVLYQFLQITSVRDVINDIDQ